MKPKIEDPMVQMRLKVTRLSQHEDRAQIALFSLTTSEINARSLINTRYTALRIAVLDARLSRYRLLSNILSIDPALLKYELTEMWKTASGPLDTKIDTFSVSEALTEADQLRKHLDIISIRSSVDN